MFSKRARTIFEVILLTLGIFLSSARADQDEPDSFDLLGYFPTKETSGRVSPYQFRFSFVYGQVNYSSTNTVTDTIVQTNNYQRGLRLELDRWFQIGRSNRRTLGVSIDFQGLYLDPILNPVGPPVRYFSGSLLFGYRLWGYGHSQPWTPEGSLLLGPALEAFPTMLVSFNLATYTLAVPLSLGARAGLRMRFPLLPSFGMLSLETAFYGTTPVYLIDSSGGSLTGGSTRSLGGNALLDFRLGGRLILGVGAYLGWFTLQYTPTGVTVPNKIEFLTTSFLGSMRLTF